ncbi:hypothetical protein [Mycolicibacterium peregrinum]|uniref:hypothetical protein n=1 Tax=Mycolicibacterium peregrinum TaxID=43304 RepID=UPI000A6A5E09|nr:hypothetical protein [Mycolicibacterium peregrinum]
MARRTPGKNSPVPSAPAETLGAPAVNVRKTALNVLGATAASTPEHWTDKDIDDYEFEFTIYAARTDNHEDAQRAAAQLTLYDR